MEARSPWTVGRHRGSGGHCRSAIFLHSRKTGPPRQGGSCPRSPKGTSTEYCEIAMRAPFHTRPIACTARIASPSLAMAGLLHHRRAARRDHPVWLPVDSRVPFPSTCAWPWETAAQRHRVVCRARNCGRAAGAVLIPPYRLRFPAPRPEHATAGWSDVRSVGRDPASP